MIKLLRQLIEDVRDKGVEAIFGRYYGIYQCIVKDNKDEEKRGRVRVEGQIFPGSRVKGGTNIWIPPKSYYTGADHGIFFPPEIDTFVFVSFVDGDPGRPFYDGGFWTTEGGSSKAPFLNLQTTNPSIRGIRTKTGFEIIFAEQNDENDSPYLKIITPKSNQIVMNDKDDEESITIQDKESNIYYSNKEGISVTDKFGNSYVTTENGIEITDANSNKITKNSGGVTIDVMGSCKVNATNSCTIDSPNVKITGARATISGTVTPNGGGAFCGLPVCVFSGAPHVGTTSAGNS
jgi:hypothetical protein